MATQTSAVTAPHTSSTKLEDQAAATALYVKNHKRNKSSDGNRFLEDDHKLSSAGVSATLKYAGPKDITSFPSSGLKKDDSAASTAATSGWANQRPFEHWKPDPSLSASKAAMLAADYKAPSLWRPEQSADGAKAAALAAKDGGKVEIRKPGTSLWGNSAANQAFKSERSGGLSPQDDYGYTTLGRQGSLMAATGAMSGPRKRSDSMPVSKPTYPKDANANSNALSAATHASNPARKLRIGHAAISGSSPFTNMPKEMYTSHPPVAPEVDEKRRSDVLHASAVAMAKQIYSMQQRHIDQAAKAQQSDGQSAAMSAHGQQLSTSSTADESQPMRFNSLEESAQKLAQERLAKLHDEHAQNREYRNYYGNDSPPTSRLLVKNRVRRRTSSDGTLDEDRERSQKIRAQMSLFSSSLSEVDAKKRQRDRDALMVVAQRNVTASLHKMDERVFKETGKIAPSMLNEWQVKAHAAAQKNSDTRMENYGKINVGGGKFIDQSVVDAAAVRNVQPVLDEINAKAEKERVRQAKLKLEQEANRRSVKAQRIREKEVKEINKKLKRKEEEKARKEEKAAKAEQKRTAKEDKRKSKESPVVQRAMVAEPAVSTDDAETESPIEIREAPVFEESSHTTEPPFVAPADVRTSMEIQAEERLDEIINEGQKLSTFPDLRKGLKGWLKSQFAWRHSKGQKSESKETGVDKTFVGGSAMTGAMSASVEPRKSSLKDVALAGKSNADKDSVGVPEEERAGRSKRRSSSVSSVSAIEDRDDLGIETSRDEDFEEARDHFDTELASPPTFAAMKSVSPVRDSKFHEVM